jgi:DNA polymerase-4
MHSLVNVCPDIEVFSVDEAFIDLTSCQKLYGSPEQAAHKLKQTVYRASGLLCSLGLSGDKTTAKYAAKLNKPDGFTVIPPWQAKATLQHVPVTELCGIGKGIGNFLKQYGVHYCGDMEKLPISVLSRRFGNLGRRIWYMCQGADPDPLHPEIKAAKSIGHGKVLPPNTRDRNTLLTYLQHMSSKVGSRMRRFDMEAKTYWIGLRCNNGWIGSKSRLAEFGNDQQQIYQLCCYVLDLHWSGEGIHQVQVTALDPRPANMQMDMFNIQTDKQMRQQLNKVMDNINERYGEFVLSPARLLNRSDMPYVIAPAWKPDGLRQTINMS